MCKLILLTLLLFLSPTGYSLHTSLLTCNDIVSVNNAIASANNAIVSTSNAIVSADNSIVSVNNVITSADYSIVSTGLISNQQ